jgi:hypothetical protein
VACGRMLPSVRPLMRRRTAAGLYGSSRTGSTSTPRAAARALAILQEVGTTRNRPLILEALFIAENIATGPQRLDHAFEIDERFG